LPPRLVILGNPENRRVQLFQQALVRRGLRCAEVLSWLDFLRAPDALERVARPGDWVRVDSPGENFEVERALLRWGLEATPSGAVRIERPEELVEERGRVLAPAQLLAGWTSALAALRDRLPQGAVCLQDPDEVACLFDKPRCHEHLRRAGVLVPRAIGRVEGYEQLREAMRAARCPRVFVKLRGGSSASGVIALETSGARVQATTSLETEERAGTLVLFNSLRVRRHRDGREVARLIDALAAEGVHVEQWIPKASLDQRAFDLRVLAIAGEPLHTVVRTSRTPLTNLHLGNARGDLGQVRAMLGASGWERLRAMVTQVASAFPRCLHLGVDVLLSARRLQPLIAEVNAFGDLLPGIEIAGASTYDAELEALLSGRFPPPLGALAGELAAWT
jgi:hypothetical protein